MIPLSPDVHSLTNATGFPPESHADLGQDL